MTKGVFSDFEIDKIGIKFNSATSFEEMNCGGSVEEEMESKTVTKSCRGVVVKKIVRGTGNGTLKITAHVPWAIYTKFYGMGLDTLLEGVNAYGKNSKHEGFAVTMHVTDEDGAEKLKAYPNCIMETGITRKVENGAEEVAELELEISAMPDEYGNGMYEALVSELSDSSIKNTWMTAFEPDLVQVKNA